MTYSRLSLYNIFPEEGEIFSFDCQLLMLQAHCVLVPSKALADPGELDRALTASLTSGLTDSFVASATAGAAPNVFQVKVLDKGKTNWKKFKYVQKKKG